MDNSIVLTGGGTAGHVCLNINLQSALKKHFKKIVYIGSKTGIEKNLINTRTSYEFREIDTVKLERNKIFKNILIPIKLHSSVRQAEGILKEVKPSIIFSKGGYVGLPVAMAGKKLGIPVVCHESDLSMGLANKIAKKYASAICTNFKVTAEKSGKQCYFTGMPIRCSKLTKQEAKDKLKLTTQKPILLVVGGSLGAKTLNTFVTKNIKELTKDFFVYHITGKGNINRNIKSKDYFQTEFSDDMPSIYRVADFAISRAGANTMLELISNNVLTIFVPLPKGVSRGDQIENAKYMHSLGVAEVCMQENLGIEKVQNLLKNMQNNAQKYKNSIKNANIEDGTQKILDVILTNKKTPA